FRFLDLGCGDGVLARAIVDRYPEAVAVLSDFSEPMLDAARRRLSGHPAAHFLNADYAMPTWTQAIDQFAPLDAVVSGFSIHHQPDERKREVYSEIFGLLQPGGVFLNVEHVSSASKWVESVHDDLFVDHLKRVHPGRTRAEVAANY